METTTLEAKVHDFLAQKRIAVAGVSRRVEGAGVAVSHLQRRASAFLRSPRREILSSLAWPQPATTLER
jgi:hypothetical protein